MKISDVQTHTVNNGTRNYTFVTVTEENGLYGIGESGCSGKDNAVAATVEHYRPLLIGQDPSRIEHIWQDHFRGNFWARGPGAHGGNIRARHRALGSRRQGPGGPNLPIAGRQDARKSTVLRSLWRYRSGILRKGGQSARGRRL